MTASEERHPPLECSFCGKGQHEVQALFSGPNVFICDECVRMLAGMVGEPAPRPTPTTDGGASAFGIEERPRCGPAKADPLLGIRIE